MSWLGGPLPGTGEKIGLDPTPKFDPNYEQFYDDGGWTETIIGPDMSEEIYSGTVGDSKWNEDINGGVANVDEWIKMIEDKSKENQFLDNQKFNTGIGSPQSQQMFQQISPSVTLTRDGVPFSPYGSAAKYASLGAGGMQMAGQSLGITDIAKMGMKGIGSALANKALYAINPVLGAVNQFYPGGAPAAFKDVTRFAGDAFGGIAKGAGNVIGGIFDGIGDFFCDERLKVDIAPLESTEVNDELAQMAFFVKGLRECS